MYCSSCGSVVVQGLNYCKNCGAKVGEAKERDIGALSETSFNTLVSCIVAIPIAGLAMMIGLMAVMKEIGFSGELMIIFVSVSFLLLAAAEAIFIWLLWSRSRTVKETVADNSQFKEAQLDEVVIKGLNEAQALYVSEPIPSIIEDTTRNLEPILRETKKL